MSRTLLAEGNRDCPECGETKERLSRHWSYCEFPNVDGDLRALLTGILLGGGSLQGNGENTKHLLVQTTSEPLARWLFDELGWLAHSLRRETSDGGRDPLFHVRTHAHTYLRRLRDDWYVNGDKSTRADASLTSRSARMWWALAGGLEWTGDYDSQVRGTFSAEADDRADAIVAVLDAHGFEPERLDRRVCLFGDDLQDWLEWTRPPAPGVEHKWVTGRIEYRALRSDPQTESEYRVAFCEAALRVARERTEQQLTPERFDARVDVVDSGTVKDVLSGGSWDNALSVAGVSREPERSEDRYHWSKKDAIDAVSRAARSEGEPLTQKKYEQWRNAVSDEVPTHAIMSMRWGWADTVREAGVEPGDPTGRNKSSGGRQDGNCTVPQED